MVFGCVMKRLAIREISLGMVAENKAKYKAEDGSDLPTKERQRRFREDWQRGMANDAVSRGGDDGGGSGGSEDDPGEGRGKKRKRTTSKGKGKGKGKGEVW